MISRRLYGVESRHKHYMLIGINSHDHKIILNGVKLKSNNDIETTRSIIKQKLNRFDVYI